MNKTVILLISLLCLSGCEKAQYTLPLDNKFYTYTPKGFTGIVSLSAPTPAKVVLKFTATTYSIKCIKLGNNIKFKVSGSKKQSDTVSVTVNCVQVDDPRLE